MRAKGQGAPSPVRIKDMMAAAWPMAEAGAGRDSTAAESRALNRRLLNRWLWLRDPARVLEIRCGEPKSRHHPGFHSGL
jgi:hypothetical protein